MTIRLFFGSFFNYLYNDIVCHIPFHNFRMFFLRCFNKKINNKAIILKHAKILNFWNFEIAERSIINQYCLIDCRHYSIKIGSDSDIGAYTKIWTLGHKPDSETHELYGGNVTIENNVWIASSAIILPGVVIERGAVVAAGSVVHKNVQALEIVAGNPAKLIRMRNNPLTYKLNYNPIFE